MAARVAKRKLGTLTEPIVSTEPFVDDELELDKGSDSDDDSSDSSVYSDLEEEEDGESDDESSEGEDEEDGEEEDDDESDTEDSDKKDSTDGAGEEIKANKGKNKSKIGKIGSGKKNAGSGSKDEYEYDSSDEEDIRNTIGNIPTNWYNDYPHLGYDLDGKQIRKPKRGDELEFFLSRMENPEHGVTVTDPYTGQDVVLSQEDADLIQRLRSNKVPQAGYDMYGEWPEWFSSEVLETPLRDIPESKKSFLPSHWERIKVGKMVHAIKMGWMKPRQDKKEDDNSKKFYMLWHTDDQVEESIRRVHDPIPAPKMKLPGNIPTI